MRTFLILVGVAVIALGAAAKKDGKTIGQLVRGTA